MSDCFFEKLVKKLKDYVPKSNLDFTRFIIADNCFILFYLSVLGTLCCCAQGLNLKKTCAVSVQKFRLSIRKYLDISTITCLHI